MISSNAMPCCLSRFFWVLLLHFIVLPGTIFCLIPVNAEAQDGAVVEQAAPQFLRALKAQPEFKVAVLPMENLTVEGDIAFHFRTRLQERLRAKGFSLIDSGLIDESLYKLGVAHAGQLKLLPFAELQKLTSADGFLSGVVEQGAVQHGGVYNSYVFTCSLKLQDRQGNVLWSSLQNRVAKRRFAIDPINMFLDIALTEGGGNMQEAVYALADKMLAQLPDGPVRVVSGQDSLLDKAFETKAKEE
ncbi:MAG: hypothetical protein OEL83_03480 [Desulforhopalus sp.]|nr:hypothetical protein [Desulforhopalus sp.]